MKKEDFMVHDLEHRAREYEEKDADNMQIENR